MRPWAEWTAKTALVAAGLAAAGGVLSGPALAGTGGIVPSATTSVLGANDVTAPVSLSADACGIAGVLLGIAGVDCRGDATTVTHLPGRDSSGTAGAGSGRGTEVGSGNAVSVPVSVPADVCGDTAGVLGSSTARCAGGASSSTVAGSPALRAAGASASAPGASRIFDASSGATSGTGSAGVPDASQLAGLGALPGLADLPSLAGLANMPALNGESVSATPMPGTTLSAAGAAGLSSNSYAALAVGSLLAGASALKIAGRRARDRKAGIAVAIPAVASFPARGAVASRAAARLPR